jgi:hypothetical protein
MGGWRLTVRHGSKVGKETFDGLEDATAAMRAEVEGIIRAGPLESVQGFREYDPAEQVAARLELSSGGVLGRREAGMDVMGDGALVPYVGIFRKRRLNGQSLDQAIEAVAQALR